MSASKHSIIKRYRQRITVQGGAFSAAGLGGGDPVGGGKRGEINGMSPAARRRLINRALSLDEKAVRRGWFVTLTYTDDCLPADFKAAKRDLHTWSKRLAYDFPDAWAFWVCEWKARKMGAYVGRVVPHYHLIVCGLPQDKGLARGWLLTSWGQVIGAFNGSRAVHFGKHGVKIIRPYGSLRGVAYYISKYVSKAAGSVVSDTGRVWGIVNRDKVQYAPEVVLSLGAGASVHFRRLVRSWLRVYPSGSRYSQTVARCGSRGYGYTVYGLPLDAIYRLACHASQLAGEPVPIPSTKEGEIVTLPVTKHG